MFKNYCVLLLGDTKDFEKIFNAISDPKANTLDAKGIVIATFSSVLTIHEINDYLISKNKNFLSFELNEETSGYNIIKKDIRDALFGFIKTDNKEREKEFIDFINTFENEVDNQTIKIKEEDIISLNKTEKDDLFNKLIDFNVKNGIQNISEEHKKLLDLLAKN